MDPTPTVDERFVSSMSTFLKYCNGAIVASPTLKPTDCIISAQNVDIPVRSVPL